MKIHENIMKINENLRKHYNSYENLGKHWKIKENLGKLLEIYANISNT